MFICFLKEDSMAAKLCTTDFRQNLEHGNDEHFVRFIYFKQIQDLAENQMSYRNKQRSTQMNNMTRKLYMNHKQW